MSLYNKFNSEYREKYLIIFSLIAFLALLFWSSYTFQDYFYGAIHFLEKYINDYPVFGLAAFIGLSAASAVISPFTSVPLIPVAIIIFGKFLTFSSLWFGWILGGVLSYLLGLYAVRPLVIKIFSDEKIDKYQKAFSQKSNFWLVLLFRSSVPAEIPGPVLGALKYSPLKFTFATAIAELPYAIAIVYASNSLLIGQKFCFLLWVGSIFIVMSIIYFIFHKKIQHP